MIEATAIHDQGCYGAARGVVVAVYLGAGDGAERRVGAADGEACAGEHDTELGTLKGDLRAGNLGDGPITGFDIEVVEVGVELIGGHVLSLMG
ncbi:hypothetical protein D3C84_1156170 [compost metagenome]